MNKSKNSSDDEYNGKKSNLDRSRENEIEAESSKTKNNPLNYDNIESTNNIEENYKCFKKNNFINKKISLEDCIMKFDDENMKLFVDDKSYAKIKKDVSYNFNVTPIEKQDIYKMEVIQIIKGMNKSKTAAPLPKLRYGIQLSDDEFIDLLKDCVSYANYKFTSKEINDMKSKLLNDYNTAIDNLFKRPQIIKDVIENAFLALLTSENKDEQEDNYHLLNIDHTTGTPIIKMKFNDDDKCELNIKEFKDVFTSVVYVKNFKKTLENFIPKRKKITEDEIKKYIIEHFDNHYIYFCDLTKNVCAITIHTGNIYIRSEYLYQYYNEKNKESQLLIREKIILDIGHELAHALLREISEEMGANFLIKSSHNNSKKKEIEFKDKFKSIRHSLPMNESGNVMDHNFFNEYYFDNIFPREAELFSDIKNINSVSDFNQRLNDIINEEKNNGLIENQINKFKKLKEEPVRRCIRSRILRTIKIDEN